MSKSSRHSSAAAIRPQGAAPERLSPLVHHLLEGVLPGAPKSKSAVVWLVDIVARMARKAR